VVLFRRLYYYERHILQRSLFVSPQAIKLFAAIRDAMEAALLDRYGDHDQAVAAIEKPPTAVTEEGSARRRSEFESSAIFENNNMVRLLPILGLPMPD
jgi:hypothetical protein